MCTRRIKVYFGGSKNVDFFFLIVKSEGQIWEALIEFRGKGQRGENEKGLKNTIGRRVEMNWEGEWIREC